MDRLDRSICIYVMALNDTRLEPARDANANALKRRRTAPKQTSWTGLTGPSAST
jgi:hypothetical protein